MSTVSIFLFVAGILLGIVGCQAIRRHKSGLNYCPVCSRRLVHMDIGGATRVACPTGHWVHWNNPKPVVIVLIPIDGKLVLVRRKFAPAAGSWALPGGFIEAYEHPAEAAVREVLEETGLKIRIDKLLDVKFAPGGTNEILFFYLAYPAQGKPIAGDDASDAGTFSKAALPEIAFSTHRQMVHAWFETLAADAQGQNHCASLLSDLAQKRSELSACMAAANAAKKELSAAINLKSAQLESCRAAACRAVQNCAAACTALDTSIEPFLAFTSMPPAAAAELCEARRIRHEADQQSAELTALIGNA